MKEVIRVLHEIESSHVFILAQMNALAKTLPEFYLVNSFSCVGEVLAPMIIAEIGDVRRFKIHRSNRHTVLRSFLPQTILTFFLNPIDFI